MQKKTLIDTNPYLRDPEKFRESLVTCVSSSSAIETGASVESIAHKLEKHTGKGPFRTTRGSAQ